MIFILTKRNILTNEVHFLSSRIVQSFRGIGIGSGSVDEQLLWRKLEDITSQVFDFLQFSNPDLNQHAIYNIRLQYSQYDIPENILYTTENEKLEWQRLDINITAVTVDNVDNMTKEIAKSKLTDHEIEILFPDTDDNQIQDLPANENSE